jgi:hypothetical protein
MSCYGQDIEDTSESKLTKLVSHYKKVMSIRN